jgi:carbonic anhydrase
VRLLNGLLFLLFGLRHLGEDARDIGDSEFPLDEAIAELEQVVQPVDHAAVTAVQDVSGERNSKNKAFVEAVCEANVRLTVARIRELSPILRDLENAGKIQIAGCIYDLDTARVRFLAPVRP